MLLRPLVLSLLLACSVQGQDPSGSVFCDHPYALCAYANCTVNDDLTTASCGCYALEGVSAARIKLIPNEEIVEENSEFCSASSTKCIMKNAAPACKSLAPGGEIWPTADRISTFSMDMGTENGVNADGTASWSCPAVPGRKVPNCMLAPCVYSDAATNPYNSGEHTMTCTCPLIDISATGYSVNGGLQDPCSTAPTVLGAFVQNAGGPVLASFEADPAPHWDAVKPAFDALVTARDASTTATEGTTESATATDANTTTPAPTTTSSAAGRQFSAWMMMSASAGLAMLWFR